MSRYEKWLGAGLGWVITGNPMGSLLGFIAGSVVGGGDKRNQGNALEGVTEFEVNLMILAAYLIKTDGKVSLTEISFVRDFFNAHFDEKHAAKRSEILNHCLQKEYDLNVACDQIRLYTSIETRKQVVNFLLDLANCDGVLTDRENYFVFKIAGYLNINDVEYRKIKTPQRSANLTAYDILGVTREMAFADIRTAYRKLVIKYHPDRNTDLSVEEQKKLARKFQEIKEAYEELKSKQPPQ